jgi:hypothetical protein
MGMLDDVRAQYPQYKDLSDADLAGALHAKFYPDMPKTDFDVKVGLAPDPKTVTAPSNPTGRQIGPLEAFGRGALQGLSFNTSDEAWAALKSMFGGEKYDDVLKQTRDANRLAAEQNPGSTLGGEVAGGIVPAAAAWLLGPEAGAPATAATAGKIAQLGSRIFQGAKTGAKIGAAYGAGGYEGAPDESLTDSLVGRGGAALKGGAGGAAAGAVLTPAIDAVGSTASGVKNIYKSYTDPVGTARAKYGEALSRGLSTAPDTEAQANANLGSLARSSPNAIAGDVGGDPVQTLIRTSLNRPNAQNQPFLDTLANRQKNQWQEIEDNLSKHLGDPNQFDTVKAALEKTRATDANAAYKPAFDAPFNPSDELLNLFATKEDGKTLVRPTLNKIVDDLNFRLKDQFGDEAPNMVDQNPLEFIHQVKVELDHQIGQAKKVAARGDVSTSQKYDLRSLVQLKKALIDGVEKSAGDGPQMYLQANKQFSNSSALINAMDDGRAAAQKTDDVIRGELQGLTPAEQDYYRFGISRGLADKNRTGNAMNDRIGRDWSDPQDQFRLKAIFGPNASEMRNALDAMETARDLRRSATGNSTTAKQLLANDDAKQEVEKTLNNLGMMKSIAQGNWADVGRRAYHITKAELSGINPAVAEEILKFAAQPASKTVGSPVLQQMVKAGASKSASAAAAKVQRDRAAQVLLSILGSSTSGALNTRAPN